jgi:membrane associated rhomboid family serine protease
MNVSGWPWWAQLFGLIIFVLLAVFVFREVVLPLLNTIT